MSLPTEQDAERALNYLAETDEPYAKAYAAKDAFKERIKLAKAKVFLESRANTVKEREAEAESSEEVASYVDDWENAVADWKLMDNKRKRAELTIDVWRSVNASRRRN